MTKRFVYIGTMDDVVERFPFEFDVTPKIIQYSLAHAVLIGQIPVINDGYLWTNRYIRDAIYSGRRHFLDELISTKQVRVLQRHGTKLTTLVENMAKLGMPSYQAIHDLSHYDVLIEKYGALEARLSELGLIIPWPGDMTASYVRLMTTKQRVAFADKPPSAQRDLFMRTFDKFIVAINIQQSNREDKGARGTWERACDEVTGLGRDKDADKRWLMRIANETYHYNFGVMLAGSAVRRESDAVYAVETHLSPNLIGFHKQLASRPDIPARHLRVTVPRRILAGDADLSGLINEDISLGRARRKYVEVIDKCMSSATVDQDEVVAASRTYQDALHSYFYGEDPSVVEILRLWRGAALNGVRAEGGMWKKFTAVVSSLGDLPRLVFGGALMDEIDDDIAAPDIYKKFQHDFDRGEALSTLRVDPATAAEFVGNLPPFEISRQ